MKKSRFIIRLFFFFAIVILNIGVVSAEDLDHPQSFNNVSGERFMVPDQNFENNFDTLKSSMPRVESAIRKLDRFAIKVRQAGYPVEVDVDSALLEIRPAVEFIKSATEFNEEVAEKTEVIQNFFQVFGENLPQLQTLSNLPRVFKRADREIERIEKQFTRVKARFDSKNLDYSVFANDIQTQISDLKAVLLTARSDANTGDGFSAQQILGEDFFPQFGDVKKSLEMMGLYLNLSRSIPWIENSIVEMKGIIARSRSENISELQSLITEIEQALAEMKTILNSSSPNMEEASSIARTIDELKRDFFESFDHEGEDYFKFDDKEGPFIRHPFIQSFEIPN